MTIDDEIIYPDLVREALRSVVRQVLRQVVEEGFPGEHYAYLTFSTLAEGVEMPPHLFKRFEEEITIVLQHQYWDLTVDEDTLGVTLAFDGKRQRLVFPWQAMVSFVDPAAKFGLRFEDEPPPDDKVPEDLEVASEGEGGKIVSLDDFRKKK